MKRGKDKMLTSTMDNEVIMKWSALDNLSEELFLSKLVSKAQKW